MPDTTTAFDIETFNDATQRFWDMAYQVGYRKGQDDTRSWLAVEYARSLMELAKMYLEAIDREQDIVPQVLRVERILGCTPMIIPEVRGALFFLRALRQRKDAGLRRTPNWADVQEALEIVTVGLKSLSSKVTSLSLPRDR